MTPGIEYLGSVDGKEYYWDIQDRQLVWRVPDIREAVVAEPGYKILCSDYSQIEVRIMAFMSQDPWLISALNSGRDIHCHMASEVYGIPYQLLYDAYNNKEHPQHKKFSTLRSNIKTCTFGIPLTHSGFAA